MEPWKRGTGAVFITKILWKLVGFDVFFLEDPFFKWLIWGYPHFRSF
jgi:hypothetical protein